MPVISPVISTSSKISSENSYHSYLKNLIPFAATASVALTEGVIFHPFDTVNKRLMNNPGALTLKMMFGNRALFAKTFNGIIFEEVKNVNKVVLGDVRNVQLRCMSLYPGLKWALCYKMLERTHAFAGQPILAKSLKNNFNEIYQKMFGNKYADIFIQGTAGALLGGTQFFYIPFDAFRTQAQLRILPKDKNMLEMIKLQGGILKLYAGSSYHSMRTAGSAFLLFSVSTGTKRNVFNLEDMKQATFAQNVTANTVGAIASVVITNPLDVIKTRIQASKGALTGVAVIKKALNEEGLRAFAKSIIPKMVSVAPKLIFTMTLAPYATKYMYGLFDRSIADKKENLPALLVQAPNKGNKAS